MKALFIKISAIDNRLAEISERIESVKKMQYYAIFSTEEKRQKKIQKLQAIKKRLLGMKDNALDSLRIAINLEKCNISEQEREITLNTAEYETH